MWLGVLILPELPWPAARRLWRSAEELGFDHAWTYDHLAWRSLRDSPWFSAIPTLTAAATATERIRLGTLVASPNFRHPVPFAKELMTLDHIADGRLTLGIGAGGSGWDATMLGQGPWSPRERAERFIEFVELTDNLLREEATSYEGRFYSARDARGYPGCVQRPRIPFAVAATGRRGMRLAATYGEIWVTTGDRTREGPLGAEEGATVVREQMARLDEVCAEVGRDPGSLRRLVLAGPILDGGLASVEAFREATGRYAEVGVTDFVVHWPRANQPYAGDLATFERIFSAVRGIRERASPGHNSLMGVVLRDEAFDGAGASDMRAAFAAEIGSLYPGWHPSVGPTAEPDEFVPPSGTFVVAYADGRPVGCGGVKRLDDHRAEIKRLYVVPELRRSGIAWLILRRLEQFACESGYAVVRLDTGARQPGALALFRSAGYSDIADYNGNQFASHWLEKRLPLG